MSWIKKIFHSKSPDEKKSVSREDEMFSKLEASIENCKAEIKKADNDVEQLKKWAIEAIRECYEVPHDFWYEELNKFEEIKLLDVNKNIDNQVIDDCDEVVDGYREQIALREAKIKLYEGLIEKYQAGIDKINLIRNSNENKTKALSKLQALEKHRLRLEQLQTDPENIGAHFDESAHLEQVKKEVDEVYEDFEISEEVRTHMLKINHQFQSANKAFDSKAAIIEIEELLKKIKEEKQ